MNEKLISILIILLIFPSSCLATPIHLEKHTSYKKIIITNNGLMDNPWPMYCHDVHHTGRSQYSTASTPFIDKWWFKVPHKPGNEDTLSFINIANDGTIYLTYSERYIYALYPNGTLKWTLDKSFINGKIECHPAIDENGTIYFGTWDHNFYAINPDGTIKFNNNSTSSCRSSPAIGEDGTIYFTGGRYLNAMYPNGTIKWRYELISGSLDSSPAIGDDGKIYCGDNSGHLYSIYPNGTLFWKVLLQENYFVVSSPSITEDGTIYIATTNNDFKGHLYAVYPNGTIKWKYKEIYSDYYNNPSIGDDSTIYLLGWYGENNPNYYHLYAVNPDGSEKWTRKLNTGYYVIRPSDPMISSDGTIYIAGGNMLYAFDSNGNVKWHKEFDIPLYSITSSPVIGEDGTIYLCVKHFTENGEWDFNITFFLHAYNICDHNAPSAPEINGPIKGVPNMDYNYTIVSTDPNGDDVYYYVCWGEETIYDPPGPWLPSKLEEFGPYPSGEEVTLNHTWLRGDKFTIKVVAKDTNNLLSQWSELTVTMPKNKESSPWSSNHLIIKMIGKLLYRSTLLECLLSLK